MIIDDLLRRNAKRYPTQLAVKYGHFSITWQELDARATLIASNLATIPKKTSTIAILMENNPVYITLYFAIARAGLISVPLNYKLTFDELSQVVKQVNPQLIICSENYREAASWLTDNENLADEYWVYNDDTGFLSSEGDPVIDSSLSLKTIQIKEHDTFAIFFTSGTTGLPKGAMVSHRNLLANAYNQLLADNASSNDVNLIATPLYHMGAVFMAVTYMMLGSTQVVAPRFDEGLWVKLAKEENVSVALLVPTMINSLSNYLKNNDEEINDLRLIFYGGGPMHKTVLETAMEKLKCEFMQGYGLTETLEATFLTADDHRVTNNKKKTERLQSCGREAIGAEIKIVDDDDIELGENQPGEILIKSDSVIQGYWNQPEETANAIKNGWFYTGDIGYLDEGRYLYVIDRKKDIIISGGVNIYSKEIENVLLELSGVHEIAVIGLPDKKWGEAVTAVIVKENNAEIDESTVINYCTEKISSYKKPKSIHFLDELPKNPSGKILKRELRNLLASS